MAQPSSGQSGPYSLQINNFQKVCNLFTILLKNLNKYRIYQMVSRIFSK